MTPLMDSFWIGLILGSIFGFFIGLLMSGLLRHASEAELRLAHHLNEKSPFSDVDDYWKYDQKDEHEELIK